MYTPPFGRLGVAAAAAAAAAARPKKKRAALLREKEAAAEASRLAALDLEDELAALTPAERKARQQRVVEEADFENAKDMFTTRPAAGGAAAPTDSIDTFPRPVSDADHAAFGALVGAKVATVLVPRRSSKYVGMLKGILRTAVADLSADDVKELVSVCNVLANEKLKERSKADKGKKKKPVKKSLQMERGDFDGGAPSYDDGYDDFM